MFYKKITDGYIIAVGKGEDGVIIDEQEYKHLLEISKRRPTPQDGYDYRLKEDLTWELYELPPMEYEEEATEQDYIEALERLGVYAYA